MEPGHGRTPFRANRVDAVTHPSAPTGREPGPPPGSYSLEVDGQVNEDAAWFYPEPKPEAAQISGRVAFWKGVEVVD